MVPPQILEMRILRKKKVAREWENKTAKTLNGSFTFTLWTSGDGFVSNLHILQQINFFKAFINYHFADSPYFKPPFFFFLPCITANLLEKC